MAQRPTNAQALLSEARQAVSQGRLTAAERCLTAVLAQSPDHPGACQGLAVVAERRGDLEAALAWHRRLEALRPGEPELAFNVAVALMRLHRPGEAEAKLRRALSLRPGFAPAANNLGSLLLAQGRHAEAEQSLRQALAADPALVDAHYNLALALAKLGRPAEAAAAMQSALQRQPDHAPAWLALGGIHHEALAFNDALRCYQQALRVAPGFLDARFNLGKVLHDLGRHDEALRAYRETVEAPESRRFPDARAGAYFNAARLLRQRQAFDAWSRHFGACPEDLRNDYRHALFGLELAMHTGDAQAIASYLAETLARLDQIAEAGQMANLLAMAQYLDLAQADLRRCYARFNELAMAATGRRRLAMPPEPMPGRRYRIGYLSPDFNNHVMGALMYDVISKHDRERFEIVLYSLAGAEDALTARFRGICDRFVALADLPVPEAARRIADDRLDLLIDLAGHTADSRPLILAYQPAPIQITHLGYHGAVGLETVQYKITDRFADRPENDAYLIERLLPMAGCLMPFRRQAPAAGGLGRFDLGIAADRIVFGVFVNFLKLSPRCLAAWRRILERLPNGLLAFSPRSDWARDAIARCLGAAGIPEDRFVFVPAGQEPDLGRWRYRLVDLVLDTFPYSGGDTTVAALDMGVPVVTLVGQRQSERISYSLLKNLGMDGGIASDEDHYVDLACRLADSAAARSAMAEEIRARVAAGDIADMTTYARNLEDAYLQALSAGQADGPACGIRLLDSPGNY